MGSSCCCPKNKEDSFEQLCESSNASDNETISTVDDQDSQNDGGKQTIQLLEAEIKMLRDRIKEEEVRIQDLTTEKEDFIHELDDLRTRLSAVISAQVTDSNPNIADLSDQNRPTKLAERYSELYDNQWTECYEGLTKNLNCNEKESITWILGLFINIFQACEEKATKDLEQLREVLKEFQSGTTETLKTLKDKRKKSSMVPKDQITTKLDGRFAEKKQEIAIAEKFINESVELCWLMAVQDPPVYVDSNVNKHKQPLDKNLYKYYTQKGKLVDYVVWPVLFLKKDGPLLSKGIAQGFVDQMQSEDQQAMVGGSGENTETIDTHF
ncbi:uncharacterized protein LOC128227064 isoform X2 [Mya arenaria]|uniref:uncharacterized protein LOC128227064 isoform X2 n=1 Tax=Mya arenaria TaxID=6604 RepID=UPI0022E74082|nr:uncharacterized protein LOC128227064 isoform X2 [Mya arenaria]